MNRTGNEQSICAETVPLETTRRKLIAARVRVGAKTPLGHRYSNLIEQLQNLRQETDPQARKNLLGLISASVSDIRRLQ